VEFRFARCPTAVRGAIGNGCGRRTSAWWGRSALLRGACRRFRRTPTGDASPCQRLMPDRAQLRRPACDDAWRSPM